MIIIQIDLVLNNQDTEILTLEFGGFLISELKASPTQVFSNIEKRPKAIISKLEHSKELEILIP